jgi:phosphoribosylamine--glycine ligase
VAAKVLIVGGEARAHALGWKIAQSKDVEKIYFAPGNGGTGQVGENVDIAVDEHDKLVEFAKAKGVDLTVVSPEPPLAAGIADKFRDEGLLIFGPSAKAAEIEASKVFSTEFMERHKIPHPKSYIAKSLADAQSYIADRSYQDYVIKSSGLASGKGVIVPESDDEAKTALLDIMEHKIFGEAGEQVVFQERLSGQEVSAFALSDGKNLVMLPFTQDHKQLNDGDTGPNTGGMGSYTPVPFIDDEMAKLIKDKIMQSAIDGLAKDGRPFVGCLFAGLFIKDNGEASVIEFNCRFGDPECQSLMMLIEEDLYPIFLACAKGELEQTEIEVKPGAAATVCLASPGYPGETKKGLDISGIDKKADNLMLFHAGTKIENGKVVTNGGRVLSVTAYGKDLKSAIKTCYEQIGEDGVRFDGMHYRKDIGSRVL